MPLKSKIRINSQLGDEYSGYINVDGITYLIQTEDMGKRASQIISRVYLGGEVVFSRKSDYSHIVALNDSAKKKSNLMLNQHKNTIDLFVAERSAKKKKLHSDYIEEINHLLRRRNGRAALTVLRGALEHYPGDPFLLSHYGYLTTIVEKNSREGIQICRDSIEKLNQATPFGREFFYPIFFLNLGRAYLHNNRKSDAMDAFRQGLQHDPENHALLWEVRKMGDRRKPVLPFLPRSNVLNKYLGFLFCKTK